MVHVCQFYTWSNEKTKLPWTNSLKYVCAWVGVFSRYIPLFIKFPWSCLALISLPLWRKTSERAYPYIFEVYFSLLTFYTFTYPQFLLLLLLHVKVPHITLLLCSTSQFLLHEDIINKQFDDLLWCLTCSPFYYFLILAHIIYGCTTQIYKSYKYNLRARPMNVAFVCENFQNAK